jgi:hypothetical protein
MEGGEAYQTWEPFGHYEAFSEAQNDEIGIQNAPSRNIKYEQSIRYLGPTPPHGGLKRNDCKASAGDSLRQ